MRHFTLPVSPATVHWGYFSKKVTPALTLRSGDRATIETLTHHANDDYERMIAGDPGAESVFHWTRDHKAVARRGSGSTEGPFIRGAGEAFALDAASFALSAAMLIRVRPRSRGDGGDNSSTPEIRQLRQRGTALAKLGSCFAFFFGPGRARILAFGFGITVDESVLARFTEGRWTVGA